MNYLEARERKDGSGWHFTSMNDGKVHAVGYCGSHAPHATKEEAEECYRVFLVDEAMKRRHRTTDSKHKCQAKDGCSEFTEHFIPVGMFEMLFLCDQHRNRDEVDRLVERPSQIWTS